MLRPPAGIRIALPLVGCALLAGIASTAVADTIYLKNGRIIRTVEARVEGDRVVFFQYNGEVAIPMDLVERIEQDTNTGPEATPTTAPTADDTAEDVTSEDEPESEATEGEEIPPEQTREYWQQRVGSIEAEREELQLQLQDLQRQERAFIFSHRSTADTRQQIEQVQARLAELDQEMADLRDEARRLGVPAGWLRSGPGD